MASKCNDGNLMLGSEHTVGLTDIGFAPPECIYFNYSGFYIDYIIVIVDLHYQLE